MSTRAADDFAEIRRNRIRLTRICYRKLDLPTTECWCMKAGPNGEDIPCSEARDPTPWERVELGKPETASELKKPDVVLSHIGDCAVWAGRDCDCGTVTGINQRGSYRWHALEKGDMLVVGAPK